MSDRTADALYIPSHLVKGSDGYERAFAIVEMARPLLGMLEGPGPVFSQHEQDGDGVMSYFVRKTHADTKLFPKGHPRAGEVRHEWEVREDGIRVGFNKAD